MLASFDTETKEVNMLSIPRDTKMYIGNRYQKINAAHAFVDESGEIGGATATCEAVTRITGIPINYYVDFSFDAVAHVIDELGPIEFTIPDLYGDGVGMVYDDPVQSLHINLPPGDYQLNGQQAVWLMRYRHGNVDPSTGVFKGYVNGDSDRVEMQQKFLKAVVDQKVNASLILKIPSIFKDISSEIKTNFTVSEVIKYSKYLADFSSVNIHSYSLPGEYSSDSANGDGWIPNMDEIRTMVQDVFGYPADNITTDNPKNATRESGSSSSSGISSSSSNTSNSSNSSNSKSRSSNSSYSSSGTSGSSSSGSSSVIVPSGSGFAWPTPGFVSLSSEWFEDREVYNHGGIDIAGAGIMGTPVVAAADGTVIATNSSCTHNWGKSYSCGCGGGYGNYVMISHAGGKMTVYGHLTSLTVSTGQSVSRGQIIGYVGSTGNSTGPHLHYECRLNGVRYNPMSEYPYM